MTEPLTLIGVGSPFGADAIGLQVAERLAPHPKLTAQGWRVRRLDRPGTLLIGQLAPLRQVVIVDALQGEERGSMHWLGREQLLARVSGCSSHQLGVAEVIALADALGQLPQHCNLLGIGMGGAERFSEAEVDMICDKVADFLHKMASQLVDGSVDMSD